MPPSSSPIPKWILFGLLGFALFGFADAAYLTAEHYIGAIPPCSIVKGCEQVLTSSYATIAGFPTALFGTLFYLAAFLLVIMYKETGNIKFFNILFAFSFAAFLASLGFVYIQLFVLKAICLYCMGSAVTSTLIFLFASVAIWKSRAKNLSIIA
ncbi:MAG: vitamin K epoxide reductase family protein [Patescibacteria group bacterium]